MLSYCVAVSLVEGVGFSSQKVQYLPCGGTVGIKSLSNAGY